MNLEKSVAQNLAAAFLAGPWKHKSMAHRGWLATGHKGRWLWELIGRVIARFGDSPNGVSESALASCIANDLKFHLTCRRFFQNEKPLIKQLYWTTPAFHPPQVTALTQDFPPVATTAQLAQWLECTPTQLDWYSGRYLFQANSNETDYPRYRYRWIPKRSGKRRLLEIPIYPLKQVQRRLLREILNSIPPHEAVHSYRRSRSCASFVQQHVGKRVVIRMDLLDFFPSVRASRIHALFATLGYPRDVARALTGLCTNAAPASVFADSALHTHALSKRQFTEKYRSPHLPQGAPTSPMLSNLCVYRLDLRLAGLAKSLDAEYTRYADDLAFSGGRELERSYRRFHVGVCLIALEEGFEINTRKTRVMRQGVRQQLAGLTVNNHPNIARREYDRLKAILFNSRRHGPRSQTTQGLGDFRASLWGRLQYVKTINPHRARKLERLFEVIDWTESDQ